MTMQQRAESAARWWISSWLLGTIAALGGFVVSLLFENVPLVREMLFVAAVWGAASVTNALTVAWILAAEDSTT